MEQPPSRRSIVRLLLAALVATASCVSVFGLEEENYESLEDELCKLAEQLCGQDDTFVEQCLAGGEFYLDDDASKVARCFDEVDCQQFKACVQAATGPDECIPTCAGIGESCAGEPCPVDCCDDDAECRDNVCCRSEGGTCNGPGECCSGLCDKNTCVPCLDLLSECQDSEDCCGGGLECVPMSGPVNLCTKACSGHDDCNGPLSACCDVGEERCEPEGDDCCTFDGQYPACLTDGAAACPPAAKACCGNPSCPQDVKDFVSECTNGSCPGDQPDTDDGKTFVTCICDTLDGCDYLCPGGGGSGGMGGGSTSGGGGSGG